MEPNENHDQGSLWYNQYLMCVQSLGSILIVVISDMGKLELLKLDELTCKKKE